MTDNNNVWAMTLERLDAMMDLLNLTPGIRKYLRQPRKILEVAVTVKMDNVRVIRREGEEDSEIGEEYKKNIKSEPGEENFGPKIGGL